MTRSAETQEFLSRLAVTPDGEDRFVGTCHPAWPGRAFGGQVMAKALQAAAATVDTETMQPWSIHIYFHAPMASGQPATYTVERIKDGRTLANRRVQVEQDGKLRSTATVVMGVPGEGPEHRWEVPPVPLPEELTPRERVVHPSIVALDKDLGEMGYPVDSQIDLRIVESTGTAEDDEHSVDGSVASTRRPVWMKVLVDLPDDAVTSASALCYLSDIILGTTALVPHGGRDGATGLQLGALELSLWFARPAPMDQSLLFALGTPFGGAGRALVQGVVHDAAGDVVALAVQNALMRWA